MPRLLALLPFLFSCTSRDKVTDTFDTGAPPADIVEQLLAIDGVVDAYEIEAASEDTRHYVIGFTQPTDHDNPGGETFTQWLSLVHRDIDAPVVMDTRGYYNTYGGYDNEPSWLLASNRLNVEHRFFGESTPASRDWDYLRVTQLTADLHAVREAIGTVYGGPWIATGGSKGGETALLYRAAYPDDVAGTVAYVAPFNQGYPDPGYTSFFDTVGTAECRETLLTLQRTLLSNREALVADTIRIAEEDGTTYTHFDADTAFQVSVAELDWTFWQYDGDCEALPADPTDVDSVWAWYLGWLNPPAGYSDEGVEYYWPYYYQCAAEYGYPGLPYTGISDLLTVEPDDLTKLLPTESPPEYDNAVFKSSEEYLAASGDTLLLIYGEQDPWSARALQLTTATDSFSFTAPGANHGASIIMLSPDDRDVAIDAMKRWAGLTSDSTARRARQAPPTLESERGPIR